MTGLVKVSAVAEVFNGKTPAKSEHRDAGYPVLKIRDVDEFGRFKGVFDSYVDLKFAEKHRGRHVNIGDTLILNAAHNASYVGSKTYLANSETAGALATGEWLIIRCNTERVDPGFMNYWIRSPGAREAIKFIVKGIHLYPKDVAELLMPLPDIAEQRRIVDILSHAESIVRLRREAQQKAAELVPAIFVEMFGDPATNPKGWPVIAFGSVGTLDRGKSRHRPRDAAELYGGPYPFIQTGDVANSGGRITSYSATYSELGLTQSKLWKVGTLCITIAANIAKTGVLTFDACFPDSVVGFLPGEAVRTNYVQSWLAFLQPTLEANAPQAAQKNINLEILRSLPMMVPPLELQDAFHARIESVFSVQFQQATATDKACTTFDALLGSAFI